MPMRKYPMQPFPSSRIASATVDDKLSLFQRRQPTTFFN
jgi:hypothetical protein